VTQSSSPPIWRGAAPHDDDESPRTVPLPTGAVVGGRYEVVRFIAQGGMGEVYEALDRELGCRVALKRLLPAAARSRRAIERFKREIQLARRVTHPNVCRIFDLGVDDSHRTPDPAASRGEATPVSGSGAAVPPSSGSPASEGRALSTPARVSA